MPARGGSTSTQRRRLGGGRPLLEPSPSSSRRTSPARKSTLAIALRRAFSRAATIASSWISIAWTLACHTRERKRQGRRCRSTGRRPRARRRPRRGAGGRVEDLAHRAVGLQERGAAARRARRRRAARGGRARRRAGDGASPTAASAREALTVTAKDVASQASATRAASSVSSAKRAATNRLSARSPLTRLTDDQVAQQAPGRPSRPAVRSYAGKPSAAARFGDRSPGARSSHADARRQSTISTMSRHDPRRWRPRTSRRGGAERELHLVAIAPGVAMPAIGSSSKSRSPPMCSSDSTTWRCLNSSWVA